MTASRQVFAPVSLTYFVDGTDCAGRVQKVEQMVDRLPGTAAVKTSFIRQTLRLLLDEKKTSRMVLEKHLRVLGYTPALLNGIQAMRRGEPPSLCPAPAATSSASCWTPSTP